MVFYRKYRPQSLSELIGQDQIKLTLQAAFETQKLAHAYLFCGSRGTGKTSTARILAKMVNCEKSSVVSRPAEGPASTRLGEAGEARQGRQSSDKNQIAEDGRRKTEVSIPCNTCSSCLSITDGSNLDLIEIDAASNRGIDDIRELKERIKLSPTSSAKKVYIIDEVHMLTTEAFNALLKTLEEPPSHVLFILATTEAHKIPQTILSRVQRLDFQTATADDLVKAMQRVVEEEKLEVEPEALMLVARKADGSFRDCLKLLDQVASGGGKISLQKVEECLKSTGFSQLISLTSAIKVKDNIKSLEIIRQQSENGVNVKEFTTQILEILRAALLIQSNAGAAIKEDFGTTHYQEMTEVAQDWDGQHLIKTIHLIQDSLVNLKHVSILSLPLEVAVVESSLPEAIPQFQIPVNQTVITIPPPAVSQAIAQAPDVQTEPNTGKDDQIPTSTEISYGSLEIDLIKEKWNYILETIRPDNFSLEALLKQAKLMSCEEGVVILEVPYAFHQRILESPRSRKLLESVLTDILAKPAKVSTVLGKRPVKIEELANVELAQDDEIVRIAAEIFNS